MKTISPEFCQMMAQYNSWQNRSLVDAADSLNDRERDLDRGAFFGSVMGTFSHLMWGDLMWMSRFDGGAKPEDGIKDSAELFSDWQDFKTKRVALDARISAWAADVSDADLAGGLRWYSGALGTDVSRPMAMLVVHFFNHQTHHRGQIHAMLTQAGAKPDDTDLFVMDERLG